RVDVGDLGIFRRRLRDSARLLGLPVLSLRPRVGHARDEADLIGALDDAARRDSMLGVVCELRGSAACSLIHAALHRTGDAIRVEYRATVQMPCRAARRLDERAVAAQKSFLIR